MAARIIDGQAISALVKAEVAIEVARLQKEQDITPGLAVVLVGDDPVAMVYVNQSEKVSEELGIFCQTHLLPGDAREEELLDLIQALNDDVQIDGILVQLPLPQQIDENSVVVTISPLKDIDGLTPTNMGRLVTGAHGLRPATASGIIELLKRSGVRISGVEAVVVGRSTIVGKPVALMLLEEDATVGISHSKTSDLSEVCRRADVLVVASGRPNTVTADMVKDGAVVIDAGLNRCNGGKLVGDVDFEGVSRKASAITPAPGGVGPMTIAMLMRNTVEAAKGRAGFPAVA